MREWLEDCNYNIENKIPRMVRSIRAEALPVIESNVVLPRTPKELLAIGGDITDNRQSIYGDTVICEEDPNWYGLYLGGGASSSGTENSAKGVNIRINHQHFDEKRREENDVRHYAAWELSGRNPNFVILALFDEVVPKAEVYFLEAILTVIYGSYPCKSFYSLRPDYLAPLPGFEGLNCTSPLMTNGIGWTDGANIKNAAAQNRVLENARANGEIKLRPCIHKKWGKVTA